MRNLSFMLHGSKHYGKDGFLRASKTFDNSVMERKLTGKVCIVTGANQGLGLHTCQELAARGATLLMLCRSEERGKTAVEEVRAKSGNSDVHLKVCDVSSPASIQAAVSDLKAAYKKVHLLVNNAGVMIHERQLTADGFEANFATNTLGCFVLTLLLEELLVAGAPSKVIFVSSGGMLTQPLDVVNLQNEGLDGTVAYSRDKRRQAVMAERFAELWANKGVHVYSMHPGWTTTEGVKKSIPGFYNFYKNKFRELAEGADTIIWLSLEDDAKLTPGGFYGDRKLEIKHLSMGFTKYGAKEVDALWANLSALMVKALPLASAKATSTA